MTKPWTLTEDDFLSNDEIQRLRQTLRCAAEDAKTHPKQRRWLPIRDWAIIDLAMGSGLRVSELCDLACGDLCIFGGQRSVVVRNGKGGKKRSVRISKRLRKHLKRYLDAKKEHGEPTGDEDPVFCGRDGRMDPSAIRRRFKRWADESGISDHHSIHSLRHTYATRLYEASNYNLRLVQKQLGHSSISTTEVYAHVLAKDADEAVESMYGKG